MSDTGPVVLADDLTQYAVTWPGEHTFVVWTALTNGRDTRLLRSVTSFAVMSPVPDEKTASMVAAAWWADSGCDKSRALEHAHLRGVRRP